MNKYFPVLLAALLSAGAACAADVDVQSAWVRGTVAGQKSTGAFMTLTSAKGATLVGASSPVAQTVEVHEMKTEGDIMKMRAVSRVDLPAGKTVDLNGGYHVMLMGLSKELKAGDTVPLTLKIEQKGKQESVKVNAEVRGLTADKSGEHAGHHH